MTTMTHSFVTSLHIAPTEGEQPSGQPKEEDGPRDKGHWQICPCGEEEQHLEYASVIEDGVKGTGEERKDINSTHEGLGTPEFGALSSKPKVIKAFKHL